MNNNFQDAPFTAAQFSEISWARNDRVFLMGAMPNTYWLTALASEVGEIAQIVQKLERGFNVRERTKTIKRLAEREKITSEEVLDKFTEQGLYHDWQNHLKGKLSHELADAFSYLDLMATKNNIHLMGAVREKFNEVCDEMECPTYKI